jgi:hypothetical protein
VSNNNIANSSNNIKNLTVGLHNKSRGGGGADSPTASQAGDDGFGSLPATPTDFVRGGIRSIPPPLLPPPPTAASSTAATGSEYAESIPTDDGFHTSTEEVGRPTLQPPSVIRTSPSISSPPSLSDSGDDDDEECSTSDTVSSEERFSVISGEDVTAAANRGEMQPASSRFSTAAAATGGLDRSRQQQSPPPHTGQRERAVATKICTGSFSRGMERFRSESPAAAVRSGSKDDS